MGYYITLGRYIEVTIESLYCNLTTYIKNWSTYDTSSGVYISQPVTEFHGISGVHAWYLCHETLQPKLQIANRNGLELFLQKVERAMGVS